jgi:ADP-ribosylglycohydrolase
MTTTAVTKRAATGALTGLALGDALGFPTEFKDVPSILAAYGDWRSLDLPKPAIVTDDTQMTLALGRGLRTAMDRGTLGPKRLERPVREEFVEWWRSPENNRAPGNTCLRACHLLSRDERPWQDASQIHSKGCGANMRVAPVGLASDLTAHAVRLLAEGAEPTGLIGLLRSYAYENRTRYHEFWLGDLWTRSQDPSAEHFIARGWDECLEILGRLQEAVRTVSPETDPCRATGEGWIAEEAMATGLLCFLLFVDEPLTALRRAACTSGDSDSIACLAGAFAGAYLGADAWPADWADRIEYRDELLALGALWDA